MSSRSATPLPCSNARNARAVGDLNQGYTRQAAEQIRPHQDEGGVAGEPNQLRDIRRILALLVGALVQFYECPANVVVNRAEPVNDIAGECDADELRGPPEFLWTSALRCWWARHRGVRYAGAATLAAGVARRFSIDARTRNRA